MRNWNRIPPIGFSWMDMALPDYLWGIETCIHQFLLGHFLELPDYLWGIETRPWVPVLNIKGLASRLPMRNWNALAQITDPSEGFSFQTTYEELKLDCYLTTTWQSASFQTTYEELKLLQETGERFSSTSFQTTYEELKRACPGGNSEKNYTGFQTTYEELKL